MANATLRYQEFRSSGVQEFKSMANATLRYQEYSYFMAIDPDSSIPSPN
ncbi:MAG: hypothetical protein HEQ24_05180 [Dolichospermum sp. BR01]|nr:hypothetical protein [Dolichospermum sp. BR01]